MGKKKKKDIIVFDDVNDTVDKETIDEMVVHYLYNNDYKKLSKDVMKRIYKYLISVDLDDYKKSNNCLDEQDGYFYDLDLVLLCAFLSPALCGVVSLLAGGLFPFFGVLPGAISIYGTGRFLHERKYKKKMNNLINSISEDYCLLPAEEYKRLEEIRKSGHITMELIELERKEAELNSKADELKKVEDETKRLELIETGINNASEQVNNNLNILNDLIDEKHRKIEKYVVPADVLFTKKNDYKTINNAIKRNLSYIDLSFVDFSNVDVRGIDFSDCNPILLNPQTVYNKDLSNTVFINDSTRVNNVFPFDYSTNFNGVNLDGASITSEDPIFINFDGAYVSDNTNIQIGNRSINNNVKKRVKTKHNLKKN